MSSARPRPAVRLRLRILSTALTAAAVTVSATAADGATTPLSTTTRNTTQQLLTSLQTRSSASDPRYLQNNVWIDGSPDCLRCTLGPSVLAAARGRDLPEGNGYVSLAISTMDVLVRDHQRSDGALIPASSGEGGPSIQTVLAANELAWTYLILGPRLDANHRTAWSNALTKASDYLIRNGEPSYYINGNINLSVAMNMDLTARITGLPRFQTVARSSLAFAIAPPQNRWAGFGLRYTRNPSKADGSDGAAYFAEAGPGGRGFDPAYTLLQLDMAAMWFSVTGSADAKRLTNLLYNQLAPRVRASDWTVDVGGGTRRTAVGVRYTFNSAAPAVLALKGGRSDLVGMVRPQVTNVLLDYPKAAAYVSPGLSYNFGVEFAPIYLAVTSSPGW